MSKRFATAPVLVMFLESGAFLKSSNKAERDLKDWSVSGLVGNGSQYTIQCDFEILAGKRQALFLATLVNLMTL